MKGRKTPGNTMTQNNAAAVIDFLAAKNMDIDFAYILEHNDFDSAADIEELITENGGFDVEVIGYHAAMQYLMENDNSLNRSIELANDMGFETSGINSELLASLLKSDDLRSEWNDISSELQDFIADLEEVEEEE